VHVVRGGASDYVPDADARRFQAAGACVDTIEAAGHFLHVERPAELLDGMVRGLVRSAS
jgi:pimeloyl-ACP methyl ester carboxylesterase